MKMISAIILNDHHRDIEKTLKSVRWCDEVLVWEQPINGDFAKARNEAMAAAKNDWILFLDSDEIISAPVEKVSGCDGYYLRRRDIFWGREIKFGEAGTTRLLRLGNRRSGKWRRKVHEFWDIKKAGNLDNLIYHYPHPTIKDFIDKINTYTEIDAGELAKEGKKFSYVRLLLNPLGKFLQNYFFRLGFLDGWPGFVYAFMMSFHSLVVRVKMHEKNF